MQLKFQHCYIKKDSLFQKKLYKIFLKTGLEGDVIPYMIQRNVPLYILNSLWQEKYKYFRNKNIRLSFAVAELGWRGRIENIKSKLEKKNDLYHLEFQKSHVIDCDSMVVVARYDSDEIGLSLIEDLNKVQFEKRTELGLSLPMFNGKFVNHSRASSNLHLDFQNIKIINRKEYSIIAKNILILEISSLAILSMALLERASIKPTPEILEKVNLILGFRDEMKNLKKVHVLSCRVLKYFFEMVAQCNLEIHEFWMYARNMVIRK